MAELVLVIGILGIIATIGWSTIRPYIPRYRLIQVATDMTEDVRGLRMTAIATNRETRLLLESADMGVEDPGSWGGSWRLQAGDQFANSQSWEDLPIDATEDGTDDEHGAGIVDIGEGGNRETAGIGLAEWSELAGPGTVNTDAVVFTPRGWVSNPADDFDEDGYITIRLVNKKALNSGQTDEVHIRIARSGYVRMEATMAVEREDHGVGTDGSSTLGS